MQVQQLADKHGLALTTVEARAEELSQKLNIPSRQASTIAIRVLCIEKEPALLELPFIIQIDQSNTRSDRVATRFAESLLGVLETTPSISSPQ
jgi:hypothetical protein